MDIQQSAAAPPTFKSLLAAYNPWWWLELGDAASPLADSASPTRIGPGGGTWAPSAGPGFPVPPPNHHGIVSGTDHAPCAVTGGGHVNYRVAGATTDGRKALQFTSNDTFIQIAGGNMTVGDDPPWIGGDSMSILMWFRDDGGAAGHNGMIWGFVNQFQPMYIFYQNYGGGQFGVAGFDSGTVIWENALFNVSGEQDNAWHLEGFNWYGDVGTNIVHVDHFHDGVFNSTATITASIAQSWGFYTQGTAWAVAQNLDSSATTNAGNFTMQDLAILPQGTPCNVLLAADYAKLYAAR